MNALCEELGRPQDRYRTLHVVGTNGKSSVTVMTAALLEAQGLRSGACISPHVFRWSERIRIGGKEIGEEPFAAAVERVAAAIETVEARLNGGKRGEEGERITQFEAAIAASFVAFAEAGVDVAVIEAGLGGRLDATNVIGSTATALTSVGLDHVEWLGETLAAIATEKLAVLREGTTLVSGELDPAICGLARRTARDRSATWVDASADPRAATLLTSEGGGAPVPYLAKDAAVALALAETLTGPIELDLAREALGRIRLPGRAETLAGDPPLIVDAAHNEQGARALAEALPALAAGRPVHGCLSMLADKDARGVVAALAPALSSLVSTAAEPGAAMGRPGAVATDPALIAVLATELGIPATAIADPDLAIEECLRRARMDGGMALCAGSHYLLRHAWTARNDQSFSR